MILQAYDFYKLNNVYNCELQIGGSDQWGNIINGVELIRKINKKSSFGLTTPLITLSSGAKMGKTEKGAIWLNKDMLSPYDYWQYWRNTADSDVKNFLKYFTEIEIDEIDKITSQESNINNLKILLANEATRILHGEFAAKESAKTAKETFHGSGIGENLPEIKISKQKIKLGINILDLLALNKITSSKSEARRFTEANGIKINDKLINKDKIIKLIDFKENNFIKISLGKKKHYLIKLI
tara:strand:- start:542 stop:1261 length:720 start_codon:yes stop_codon:yes gene_type:complete